MTTPDRSGSGLSRVARFARLARFARWRYIAALATAGVVSMAFAVVAVPARADQATYACAPVPAPPAPTAPATASPFPYGLCVSVLAGQASANAGSTVTWGVDVWAEGQGTLPGVGVTLSVDASGQEATFLICPNGTGAISCNVGDLAAPSPVQLEAQLAIPATATFTSVTLRAEAWAQTNPSMSGYPTAGQPISVNLPSPSPSPSASSSPSASPSASTSHATATKSPSSTPATAVTSAPTVAPTSPFTLPPGTLPAIVPTAAGNVASPSTVGGQLPVIAPGAYVSTPATSPAANVEPLPGGSTSATPDAGRFTLDIGM